MLKLGRFRIPLSRPDLRLLRKSKPFWCILGDHHIWSTVLRVPITFPPDKFYGAELSAMCVPDLLGTQGTFTLFTTRTAEGRFKEGGARVQLRKNGRGFEADLEGPPNSLVAGEPTLTIPLSIRADENRARITVNGSQHTLEVGKLSEWITLAFPAAPLIKVSGICRMLVTEMGEHVSLYVTPINIDPEKSCHADLSSAVLLDLPGEEGGPVLDTRPGGGYVGAERRGDRRWHVPAADLRHRCASANGCSSPGSTNCVGEPLCVSSMRPIASNTCSGAISTLHILPGRGRETAQHRDAIEELYKRNDALVGRVLARLKDERCPDGALRSRVQFVPPRRQSQQLAARERLPDAQTGRRRRRGVAAGRRLVSDTRVCPRPHRHVPQRERT